MGLSAQAKRRAADADYAEAADLYEIPAAVVCATCGSATCPGCAEVEEPTHGSGVVAVVPWERPGAGSWERFWTTARLATTSARAFFGALPDGDARAALRFAIFAELAAIASLALTVIPLAYAAAPRFLEELLLDPARRATAIVVVLVGIPVAALGMVLLHAVWGLSLEFGARRLGKKPRWRRGLRFALYSCGWDVVTSPVGFIALSIADGTSPAIEAIQSAVRVPGEATRAYARGVHGLSLDDARSASRTAFLVTGSLLALASLFAIVAAVALAVAV